MNPANVAEQLGVTGRHLRRAFTENVGIGPKEFARTVRLQRAMTMAATSRDWARIAADAGYYDQAHLIGDFRQLVGLTPAVFFKRARPDYATALFSGAPDAMRGIGASAPGRRMYDCIPRPVR